MRKVGFLLIVVGALMAVPIPFVMGLLRHRHLETLPNPTPEDVSAGVRSSFLAAVMGFVFMGLGACLIVFSHKVPRVPGKR